MPIQPPPKKQRRGRVDVGLRTTFSPIYRKSHFAAGAAFKRLPAAAIHRTRLLGGLVLVLIAPTMAVAHVEGGAAAGLLSGLQHPISGWDHVLAMVAVGLWGAQLGSPAVWVLPVAFPMVMALGGMLGLVGIPVPGVEIGIAVSALILGALVLAELKPPLPLAAVIVGFFAIFHGHAHGTELPEGSSGLLYSVGFVIATGLLHAAGIAIGLVHRWPSGRRAIQAAGAFVAVGGVFFLWQAFV